MEFHKLTIQSVVKKIVELRSDWMDDRARALIAQIPLTVDYLRRLNREPTTADLELGLKSISHFLDACRLFLGKSQESVAHLLCDALGDTGMNWARLRKLASQEPARMAQALASIGLPQIITSQLRRRWKLEDVLFERYEMSRGRAVAGQKRGRALENDVQRVLLGIAVPFKRGGKFEGKGGIEAKCDFAIPTRDHPKIVIEAKGFEATGSKLTDFLGDVLKIAQAKAYHMYVFILTDGRGWHNRQSDLEKLVQYQNDGLIDMIYTRADLPQLARDVKHIYENE